MDIQFAGNYDSNIFGCFHNNIGYGSGSDPEASGYRWYQPRFPGSCNQLTDSVIRITMSDFDYLGFIENGFVFDRTVFLYTRNEDMFAPPFVVEQIPNTNPIQVANYDDQSAADSDFIITGLDVYRTPEFMDLYLHFNAIVDVPTLELDNLTLSTADRTRVFPLTGNGLTDPILMNPGRYAKTVHIRLSDSDRIGIIAADVCQSLEECFADFNQSGFVDTHNACNDIRLYDIDDRSPPGRYNIYYDPASFSKSL